MSSKNKTQNYALNQWVGTDPVLMEDFNADNAKIDAALAAIKSEGLKMAVGSYNGKGGYGISAPSSLSFAFTPEVVIIRRNYPFGSEATAVGATFIRAANSVAAEMCSGGDGANTRELGLAWGEKNVAWWCEDTADNTQQGADWQLNTAGEIYYYAAFGR